MKRTPVLDRYLAAAMQTGTDPVAAKNKAVEHLEDQWFLIGSRSALRELRAIDAIYERTQP